MTDQEREKFRKAFALMREDLSVYERKYAGVFAEAPHVGLGNRKTRCVNEATLPLVTCHPGCLERCAKTCYVLAICTFPRPSCRACQARNTVLRRIDPVRYYEHFYREAERRHLPIRLADGGDFENAEQVRACLAAARRHPAVHAIAYTKRVELLPELVDRPPTLHVRYSGWQGDETGEARARELGFDLAHVVRDGSGNCPYQASLARFAARRNELARGLRAQGLDTKAANKAAGKAAEEEVAVWHCRNCAEAGCGCCGAGDIRFNVVGNGF